ncbi:hypothetical protein [Palleronia rufa]|uniref:hypothetical protein n=1 Tax=Palleronia rufa TaxID=1530186 RepID=UPI0005641B77|nr:hypothetical protein [Palleronia rufa]
MDRLVADLLALLEAERAHLRRGDLAAAAALIPRKTACVEKLERKGITRPIDALTEAAELNLKLLDAAKSGVEAARDRLTVIRDGVTTSTYSERGQRTRIAAVRPELERRA